MKPPPPPNEDVLVELGEGAPIAVGLAAYSGIHAAYANGTPFGSGSAPCSLR